jgi:hypothetical protein
VNSTQRQQAATRHREHSVAIQYYTLNIQLYVQTKQVILALVNEEECILFVWQLILAYGIHTFLEV